MYTLVEFITESNKIEGILGQPTAEEIDAHERILSLPKITVGDLEGFVSVCARGHVLRRRKDQNVQVGPHIPPLGGPGIEIALEAMLDHDVKRGMDAYTAHVKYETLHPFTDGNGRSGRVIWLWMMGGIDAMQRGFLHEWYYQSLQHSRY